MLPLRGREIILDILTLCYISNKKLRKGEQTTMRNVFLTILFLLSSINIFAQIETENYKAVADKFEMNYNQDKYEDIFSLFADIMKNALPLDKTKEFLTQLKNQAGNIVERNFERYENTYAIYKTQFERALFSLNISIDNDQKINGLFVKPYQPQNLPQLERNTTPLILPFKGEWTVFWGGNTKELNYHVQSKAQKNAFDFVIKDDEGKSFKTDGITNEDYYAFGQEIIAPCDGEIVLVVEGIKDNKPGELNPIYVPGNTVILKTANNEYLFLAHFKQHTIKVKQGQKVSQGELLGLCGNSGNSSEPHIHFHIQNVEDINIATGVKCYFEKILVNGIIKTDYSPIKGEKIEAVK
jgi:murein DD-endopeptidase MepM/ murein hydrolase activator NlpD